MRTVLEGTKLSKSFKGMRVIDNLDIQTQDGEILGLIGPNGSGKTTLLNLITGFLKLDGGEINYKGESIKGLKPHNIAAKGIIRTFQHAQCLNDLSVLENLIAGRHMRTNDSVLGSIFKTKSYRHDREMLLQKADEILFFLGMVDKREVLAGKLSPGDRRKVEIGISLAAEPELLLLDEPAAGLNAEECNELLRITHSIRNQGINLVIVEHNMKVVMNLSDRLLVIENGKKIAEGSPEEIIENQEVISIYLGRYVHAKDK